MAGEGSMGLAHLLLANAPLNAVQGLAVVAVATEANPHGSRVQGVGCHLGEAVQGFLEWGGGGTVVAEAEPMFAPARISCVSGGCP